MPTPLHAWIVSLLIALAGPRGPHAGRYDEIATAVEETVGDAYDDRPWGERFERVVDLVVTDFAESGFDPEAAGDGGRSIGLGQVARAWARGTAGSLTDPSVNQHYAVWLLGKSAQYCGRGAERFGWYLAGGAGCRVPAALRESRRRARMAARLLADHRPFFVSREVVLTKNP